MAATLFLEAFGQLYQGANLSGIVSEEEDLYSVFRARAELMSWSTMSDPRRQLLWEMNEAELTAGRDTTQIGWVQVRLAGEVVDPRRALPQSIPGPGVGRVDWTALPVIQRSDVDPSMALPALIQCFDDALRRFGIVELSGLQVMASDLEPEARSGADDLFSGLNWFNTILKGRTEALIAFNHELLGGHTEAELVASLERRNIGSFKFGPVATVPEQHWIKVPVEGPLAHSISPAHSGLGVSVAMPEWTASSAAWVLAVVLDAARDSAPDVPNVAVRVTRVQ